MKWQWFNKDRLGVGFILGILFILLGLYAIVLYVNEAVGQRGAEIMVYIGSFAIFAGLVNNVVVIIYWLRMRGGRKEVKQMRNNE